MPAEPEAAGAVLRLCFGLLQPEARAMAKSPTRMSPRAGVFLDRDMGQTFPLNRLRAPSRGGFLAASRSFVTGRVGRLGATGALAHGKAGAGRLSSVLETVD